MIFDGERRVDGLGAGQDRKRHGRILALSWDALSLFACHRAFEPQATLTPEPEATLPTQQAQHDTLVTQTATTAEALTNNIHAATPPRIRSHRSTECVRSLAPCAGRLRASAGGRGGHPDPGPRVRRLARSRGR